ncbi:hypothetical protein L1049_027249 [Liquidambar formosana]|uniref:Uncharacterized protein n=1 Tax=Liquidambar formosana TaxID=63359 RepID=A0AAP0R1F3_LIQFO
MVEVELHIGEKMAGAKAESRFRPKSGGIIPPKRKLVKRMMFDYLAQSIASLFGSHPGSSSSAGPPPSNMCSTCFEMVSPPPTTSNGKNMKAAVFPNP